MDLTKVTYNVEGRVAVVSMNAPKNLNAFDEQMLADLCEAFRMAGEDDNVKVVLLNSTTPQAFSAGGDIGMFYAGLKEKGVENFGAEFGPSIAKMANVTRAMKQLPKPIVGAIQGACAGAGFNVALACDYLVAAEHSVFMQAFVKLGLIPDAGGLYLLTRAVGVNKGLQLALTGENVTATQGKDLGFVAEVLPDEGFVESAMKVAKKLSFGPATSYACMKKLVWESEFKGFEEFVKAEVEAQSVCAGTDDFAEGVFAFVEKRQAAFN